MGISINKKYQLDTETRKALQRLAREQLKLRLLSDIAVDIQICKIEGWQYKEYLLELKNEIERLINDR